MRALGVVEGDPIADDAVGHEAVGEFVEIDRLVFERASEPLAKHVVHAAAASAPPKHQRP